MNAWSHILDPSYRTPHKNVSLSVAIQGMERKHSDYLKTMKSVNEKIRAYREEDEGAVEALEVLRKQLAQTNRNNNRLKSRLPDIVKVIHKKENKNWRAALDAVKAFVHEARAAKSKAGAAGGGSVRDGGQEGQASGKKEKEKRTPS